MSKSEDYIVEFVDSDNQEEYEPVHPVSITQVVLNATDWTTETILTQLKRGNIDLSPSFQRRDAWSTTKKSKFIESLLLGLPIPQIVLAEQKDKRGRYLVLDGKQRLLTLLQFSGMAEGKNNSFKLSKLDVRDDLNNKTYADFQDDITLQDDLNSFSNQTIRTVVLRNWQSLDFLHMVFLRLNTNSTALSPQELRQAYFPGKFSNYADEKAANSQPLMDLLGNKEPDFRMRDIELLVRHLAFLYFLPDYAGNMSAFLDLTCRRLNTHWDEKSEDIKDKCDVFERAIAAAEEIFGQGNVGRKWTGHVYERRLNRAVLDVLVFYFSDTKIREAAISNAGKVLEAYKNLCVTNNDFRTAIETTTKSLTAVHDRFYLWGVALQSAISMDYSLPTWSSDNKRISFSGF